MTRQTKKIITGTVPYILIGLLATNIGEAVRLSEGRDASEKTLSFFTEGLTAAFQSIAPSFHPQDILIGALIAAALRLAVYLKSKNAKKYRHGIEYDHSQFPDEASCPHCGE